MQALSVGGRDIAIIWTRDLTRKRDETPSDAPIFRLRGAYRIRRDGSKNVRVWDPATNTILSSFSMAGDWCTSDAGKFYMSNDTDTGVVVDAWDVLTGRKLASHTLTGPQAGRLTVRQNTLILKTPAYESYGDPPETCEAHALNLKTGEHVQWILLNLPESILSPDGRRLAYFDYRHGEVHAYNLPWK